MRPDLDKCARAEITVGEGELLILEVLLLAEGETERKDGGE